MELSKKVEKLRKKKGMSQEELADAVGVSRQSVFKWESGVNTPDIDKLKKLVTIFNVSFDVLLNDNLDLDDNFEIVEKEEEKPQKRSKRPLIAVILISLCAVAALTVGTVFIVKSLQATAQKETNDKLNKKKVERVISLIDGLGEITLESGEAIANAEEAYNQLDDELKKLVTNYQVLVDARAEYDELYYRDREEKTKDDPTRNIVLSDINGHWVSEHMEWKITDVAGCSSVLYWTSEDANGSVISSHLKNSVLVGYNNVTMIMEINLYHYYSFGEEFLPVGMYKTSTNDLRLCYEDITFTKSAA